MTQGREYINTVLMPKLVSLVPGDDLVINIGSNPSNDYAASFTNGVTMDIRPDTNPNIVDDIQCCKLPSGSAGAVIMVGVHEFLDKPLSAISEIKRLIKPGGYALVAFPGKGYWPVAGETGKRVTSFYAFFVMDHAFGKVHSLQCFYADNGEMEACIVLAQKV